MPVCLFCIGRRVSLTVAGYGYWWRRHTYRVEDGLEVERFVASDDDDSQRPAMQHVDASTFVSAAPNASRTGSSGASLNRRTSIIEPVENVYEPSMGSHHYPSNSSRSRPAPSYADATRLESPVDPAAAAYAYAAAGGGGQGDEYPHSSRAMSPAVSASGRPLSGQSRSHPSRSGSRSGITSPVSDESRWSGHQQVNRNSNARY